MSHGLPRLQALLTAFILSLPLPAPAQTVGLLREVWENLGGGNAVTDLTSSPDYPDRPTSSNYVTDLFEAPTDVLEAYGQRMHGYVVPPSTGAYTFWIASDDGGALYLSTDENPANSRLVATVNGWTGPREWEREPNQKSDALSLVAGRPYYISALMKEGGGGDNLAVRWRMPDGTDQAPMVGTNLLPFGVSFSPPRIAQQPADTTAVEGSYARFSVGLSTIGPASYQWRRNGAVVPNLTTPQVDYGPVRLTDQGARFSVVVTNRLGSVTSSDARLTVTPDVTPPTLTAVLNIGTSILRVTFSEPVETVSATVAGNYVLSPTVTVRSAAPGPEPRVVDLTLDPLTLGTSYTLRVSQVRDQAQTPNAIAAGSALTFTAVQYAPAVIGTSGLAGSVQDAGAGATVSGGGQIGGETDAFQFAYQLVTGNFDRRVRVEAFSPTDPFAQAVFMARATLEADSPFAAAVATPAQVGSYFLSRISRGAATAQAGSYPANYPDTWLRLARTGTTFVAYASLDGQVWSELGRATMTLPSTLFVGFGVAGRDAARAATVQFRDAGEAATGTVVTTRPVLRGETPGPSSRHTPLAISEIMFHPRERADGRNGEFVEIYNADLIDQNLTGYRLSGSVGYRFPDGYVLPAGGYAVIARVPADLSALTGLTSVLGPFEGTNGLPNANGVVRLRNPQDAVLLEVSYDNQAPWPVSADGAGHSLVLWQPSYGESDPRAWAPSARIGGSPGGPDPMAVTGETPVLINEVLAHTDLPQVDSIELYNRSNQAVDLGGWFLTDEPATNRFRIPDGTVITPRGFLAFTETQLGFRLDAAGESIFLVHSNRARVVDAVRFGPQENGVSTGRYPDGAPEWRRLRSVTPAAENASFRVSEVVINEILFSPVSDDDDDEFVELHNRSAQPKDLSGWSLSDGVQFRFPPGTVLPAGGYFVVARDRARLLTNNPALAPTTVYGNFEGTLANGGERLALAMPDFIVVTNAFGLSETNRIDIEVDEVTYATGGQWGRWSDGLGSSLELIDPESDHLRPGSWADSDESAKAPWTTVEFTGTVDNVADGVSSDRIHLLAQGPGEYLIDDVEVLGADGSARLVNGGFESGLTGWTAQGNHRGTRLDETGGINGSRALRVVAAGRGDTAVNRVRANLSPVLAASQSATLRAKVRWVTGWPEFLLRTRGSGIEAYGRLQTPKSTGTPGARNSRALDNAGPTIADVRHWPVLPRDREPVVVSARVTDPDGVASVTLRYRLDPASTVQNLALRDDGTGGDAVAGDGVYSATLSNRTAGTLVAFRVEAVDQAAAPATSLFPKGAPQKEALIRWGEETVFGNLGVYRLWQRKADYDRLRNREPLANDNLDCTFVYGDQRVVYNAEMRGKGSPWHGGSVGSDYIVSMPDDDRVLGARDFAIVTLGNLGSDPSAQREQAAFWIGRELGVPSLHRRHVRFYENGGFKGLYEDTEEPNGQFADAWFPEGQDGDLYKIEDWFEFEDAGNNFIAQRDATLQRFTSGGQLKLARYRWAWRKRAVADSANDYREFLAMVSALNGTGSTYVAQVESLVDVDAWMRVFALQHIVGNWDAYGYNRGKNGYLYLPVGGRWKMMPWDIDFVLGSNSDPSNADVFGSNDPTVVKLWNTPAFRRVYWRAFQDAINGPLRDENIGPLLDARYAALGANGFTSIEATEGIKRYARERRQYLANGLAAVDAADLAITSNGGANFTSSSNLVSLTGRAPIAAAAIAVNGVSYPVTWSDLTTWVIAVPLGTVTNRLELAALDRRGRPIANLTDTVTVRYTGALPQPKDLVVLNEIQFDPRTPGAAFVEVHNTSATASFDLSGWQLEGVSFTFPPGSVLRPAGFMVVAADLVAFRNTYGSTVVPVGVFGGNLQNNGERLRLVQPGATPSEDRVIDDLRYDSELPWPVVTRGLGPSLQLVDPLQDNRRPANWTAEPVDAPLLATPGSANSRRATLEPFPTVWLNEVLPANLDGLRDRAGDRDPWVELHNASDAVVDLSGLFLSSSVSNLTAWAFPPGSTLAPRQFLIVWCDGEPTESASGEWHTSFRLSPGEGSVTLSRNQAGAVVALDHLAYRDLPGGKAWGSVPDGQPLDRALFHLPTPGAANRLGAPPLLVFINEWMSSNAGLVLDPADGDPEDWFELYNAGPTPADLSAFTLTDVLTNATKFVIPNGTVIPPGGFLVVWADEETGQTTPEALHVNFKLSGAGEALGLFAPDGAPVDGLSFGVQDPSESQGRFPDGGDEPFVLMRLPTPGQANVLASANQPPVLAGIGAKSVEEGTRLAFKATATDPDAGQTLRFSLLAAPEGAQIDAVTGDFSWTPAEADGPSSVTLTVRVTDNGTPARSDSESVTIQVHEVNQAPVLDPIADRAVNEGEAVALSAVARDADLPPQPIVYRLEPGAPEGATLDAASGEFRWIPTESQGPQVHVIGIRATDSATPAASVTRTFRVTVNEVN
ncbi:MAG: lamin tail domain-containing protein, partial [Verrucomicrobiales bacterium]|nr:lamin tail domain-containing protein [Verrucomicrobiales bacterium]